MRFAFISAMAGSPWGGSEELWSQAALRLIQNGCPVAASVARWPVLHRNLKALQDAGAVLDRRSRGAFLWQRGIAQLVRQPWATIAKRGARRRLSRMSPDFVCISQGAASDGLPWMLACREANVPYVVIAQANAEHFWPSEADAALLAVGYRSARASFFVSQRNRELLEDQIAEALPNARLIRNPFKVDYNARPPWPSAASAWRLACVARLDPAAKGQDLLIRVLASDKWKGRPIRADLYGTGPFEGSLRQLARRFGVTAVDFKGQVEDIEQVWREHHALVLPSRFEGLPISVVEAMLCQRMAVVTDVAGNAEFVEHGISGFVAAAPTVGALDAALEAAWQRREDWEALGIAARRRVVSLVPPDPVKVFCDQLLALASPGSSPSGF